MAIDGDRYNGAFFRPDDPISATKLNDLSAQASRGQQWFSNGQQVVQGTFGTVQMGVAQQASGQTYDYPFKVGVGSKVGGGYEVFVRPGTVNNLVVKMGGHYLDETPAPSLSFSTITASNKKIVALKVTKDGIKFFPATAEIVLLDNDAELTNTDSAGYLQLASITCSSSGGTLSVQSVNQYCYACQIVTRVKPGSATAFWSFTSR